MSGFNVLMQENSAVRQLAVPVASKTTLGLCMIARNEAQVLPRLANSVLDVISHWTICDTGSTDGTPEIATKLFSPLPGRVVMHDWSDFGTNRNLALEAARGTADYLLLLDADHTLRQRAPLPSLGAEAYLVEMLEEPSYWLPRVVRGDLPWRYEGFTHEYLHLDRPYRRERLEALAVLHSADGGSRATKLEHDRELLERSFAADPENPRTVFYLAQTYRDLGDVQRAVELYERRAAMDGWDEETFYAKYQAGTLLCDLDPDRGAATLLHAWEMRPRRAEPLYELAKRYREAGKHHLAFEFARIGVELPMPTDEILFVHQWVYEWGLLFEWSIAAYWVGNLEGALAANDRLLALDRLPGPVREAVVRNRHFCTADLGIGELLDSSGQRTG